MLRYFTTYLVVLLLSLSLVRAQSAPAAKQENIIQKKAWRDSSKVRGHSPTAAMIFSTCIPGLGQAYNKKYWKIPIVYGSMGATLYFFDYNNKLYRKYKQAYINKTDTSKSTIDVYPAYEASWLLEQSKSFRKYRDLNVILTVLFYTVNIVDAYVDAHLMNFDVSDDLSLNIAPSLNLYSADSRFHGTKPKPSAGVTLTFKF